ncbi:Regulating synaptic membrane exocytosis protein 2 [Sarcoptes scabiei]|nr:Regulating synaptic membrane exocytosis protein 2 [Sarcoptes scabiei]
MDFRELESLFPKDNDGTIFLFGLLNRTYPGATIGKHILGLRVISCNNIQPISLTSAHLVRVTPAGNIGIVKLFLRTLVKLLPISNTIQTINILTSRYNRSYFDAKMGCLVVDMSAQAMLEASEAASQLASNSAARIIHNRNRNRL